MSERSTEGIIPFNSSPLLMANAAEMYGCIAPATLRQCMRPSILTVLIYITFDKFYQPLIFLVASILLQDHCESHIS